MRDKKTKTGTLSRRSLISAAALGSVGLAKAAAGWNPIQIIFLQMFRNGHRILVMG